MKKKPSKGISAEDSALFRQAVEGTRPLKHDKVETHRTRPAPRVAPQAEDHDPWSVDGLSDEMEMEPVAAVEELLFQRPGLQTTVMRKLRRGQFANEAELDLHGMRVEEARSAVGEFLDMASRQGLRCVRIVHGKGYGSRSDMPVLKNRVNGWLRQRAEVLAFCSARPVDGGTGAVYVLIKRGGN